MPFYDYYCKANGRMVEVKHSMHKKIKTWKELCVLAKISIENTSPDTPVERMIANPQVSTPIGDSRIKELGFTKLVKRDKGVYENVTATGKEKKIITPNDPSSMPHLNKKVSD